MSMILLKYYLYNHKIIHLAINMVKKLIYYFFYDIILDIRVNLMLESNSVILK